VEWEALAWQLRRLAAQVVAAIAARPCGAGALAAEADTKLDSDDEAGARARLTKARRNFGRERAVVLPVDMAACLRRDGMTWPHRRHFSFAPSVLFPVTEFFFIWLCDMQDNSFLIILPSQK